MQGKQYKVPVAGSIPDQKSDDFQEKITFIALDDKTYMVDYLVGKDNHFTKAPEDKKDDEEEEKPDVDDFIDEGDDEFDVNEYEMNPHELEGVETLLKDRYDVRTYDDENTFNEEGNNEV